MSARDKFLELQEKRLHNVKNSLRVLGNLHTYEWVQPEIVDMFRHIRSWVDGTEAKFASVKKRWKVELVPDFAKPDPVPAPKPKAEEPKPTGAFRIVLAMTALPTDKGFKEAEPGQDEAIDRALLSCLIDARGEDWVWENAEKAIKSPIGLPTKKKKT